MALSLATVGAGVVVEAPPAVAQESATATAATAAAAATTTTDAVHTAATDPSPSRLLSDVPSLAAATDRVGDGWVQVGAHRLAIPADGRVDWTDPHGRGRSYQRLVHGLIPVRDLAVVGEHGDVRTTELAVAVSRSWVAANPRSAPADPMAWHDETTARRLESLLILHTSLDAIGWRSADLRWLEQVARDHVVVLLDDGFHSAGTNHGMFQDRSLLAWAMHPMAATADLRQRADDTATRRLIDYFEVILSADGVHLEHSPAYHQVVMRNMARIVAAYRADGRPDAAAPIATLLAAAGHYATHVIQPNGQLPQVGDTSVSDARPRAGVVDSDEYRFAISQGAQGTPPREVDAFYLDADTAVMRDAWTPGARGTYLHLTAAYHVSYHKHADDLSLWLYHDGELLTEAGMNGYQYDDPFTAYGFGATAHNTVLVDGRGVERLDGRYDRVGLTSATSDGTVSVVTGRTARFPNDAAVWERTVVYDRSVASVQVTDRVATARPGAQRTVLWHTAPDVTATVVGRQVFLHRNGTLTARLRVGVGDANLPVAVVEGQRSPVLGWRLGNVEAPRPTQVLRFRTTEDRDIVTTIELVRPPEPVDISARCPDAEAPFVDVAGVHAGPIACLHRLGIAQGTDDGTRFEPHLPVRRDQMASFLLRTLEQAGVTVGEVDGAADVDADVEVGGEVDGAADVDADVDADGEVDGAADGEVAGAQDGEVARDVPASNVHAGAIAALNAVGVVEGDADGFYRPAATITRAQLASMLDRAATFAGRPLPDGDRWFADVAGVHADAIDRLTAAGITGGDGVGGYGPSASVDRDQLATFLARLLTYLAPAGDATGPDG